MKKSVGREEILVRHHQHGMKAKRLAEFETNELGSGIYIEKETRRFQPDDSRGFSGGFRPPKHRKHVHPPANKGPNHPRFSQRLSLEGPALAKVPCNLSSGRQSELFTEIRVGVPQVCAALRAWSNLSGLPSIGIPSILASRVHGHLQKDDSASFKRMRATSSHDVMPMGIPLNEVLAWVEAALQRCDQASLPEVALQGIQERAACGSVGLRLHDTTLPDDVAKRVLSFLSPRQLCMAARTSRNFRDAVRLESEGQDSVWKQHCASRFDIADSLYLGGAKRRPWKVLFREAFVLQEVRLRGVAEHLQAAARGRCRMLRRTPTGGFVLVAELERARLTFFLEARPFFMSSRTHSNSLTGSELDYAIARFLETMLGQWAVLQGAEDTELLRKDAVHHLVKLLGGDETGDAVFDCFAGGGDTLMPDFMAQCHLVELFMGLFGDKARYFNNGEFSNNSSDGFPLAPPGLGALDSGVVVVGADHMGLLWAVEQERAPPAMPFLPAPTLDVPSLRSTMPSPPPAAAGQWNASGSGGSGSGSESGGGGAAAEEEYPAYRPPPLRRCDGGGDGGRRVAHVSEARDGGGGGGGGGWGGAAAAGGCCGVDEDEED